MFRLLEHYEEAIKAVAPTTDAKVIIVREVFDFWKHSEQVGFSADATDDDDS
jgi:hypothetical protein